MGITDDKERDFTKQSGLKRSGRIDLRLFQNTNNAGDGYPGLQKMIRNFVGTVYTEAELIQAITNIGSGMGVIILDVETISLTSTINISGGGSYIIQGKGDNTIIDCNSNRTAFNITSATSCILRDFKILCNDISDTTPVIDINEISDNKVIIDNVKIDGSGNGEDAYGIKIQSDNCIIQNCQILEIRRGLEISGNYNFIINNYISNLSSSDAVEIGGIDCIGINSTGNYNKILGNIINNVNGGDAFPNDNSNAGSGYGIINTGNNTIIANNSLYNITGGTAPTGVSGGEGGDAYGIYNTGNYVNTNNNNITTVTGGNDIAGDPKPGDAYGILYNNSLYGTIEGNVGTDIDCGGGGGTPVGVGIGDLGTADYNIWLGNNFNGEGEAVTGANNIENHNLT